jgi:peroxiredoxin
MSETKDRGASPSSPPAGKEGRLTVADAAHWLRSSGVLEAAVQRGEMIPDFTLESANGALIDVQSLLDAGPLVITFTLGRRSVRCRQSLLALNAAAADIARLGAGIVAVTPDPPRQSRLVSEAQGLAFDLLSDENGHLAALFGLAYRPPEAIADWLVLLGADAAAPWPPRDLPLTATYIVASDGIAAWVFVAADPLARVEPAHLIAALARLRARGEQPEL